MSLIHTEKKDDLAITLARHAVNIRGKDLTDEVVEITKKHILDQIAVIIGGSNQPGCIELVGQLNRWGGKEEATIFSYGNKVPSHHAAQANATMGHALDYDDCDDRSSMHAGAAVIASAFTAAELRGKVNGHDFITAISTGLDIGYRLALCFPIPVTEDGFIFSWFHTQLFSYISTPITAGKILDFDEEQMINAIGIAFQEAAGSGQFMIDGGLNKRLAPGYAARAGIFACLLAQNNVTGVRNTLEGQAGLFKMYLGGNIVVDPFNHIPR